MRKIVRLHSVVVAFLDRPWAFEYVLKCAKYIISYIDNRISRKKDIDVKELVSLCNAEEALSLEIRNAFGSARQGEGRNRRQKTKTSAQRTATFDRLPPGLSQAITALEEKLRFMKEHASTRAYTGGSKKAPPVVRRSQRILQNQLRHQRSTTAFMNSQMKKLPLLTLNDNDDDDEYSGSNSNTHSVPVSTGYDNNSINNNNNNNSSNNNSYDNEYAFNENVNVDDMDDDELLARFTTNTH